MKFNSRIFFTSVVIAASASYCSAATFVINKVFTVQSGANTGTPYIPHVGEPYSVGVTFTVTGTPSSPYNVLINLADHIATIKVTDLTPGSKYYFADFGEVPLDDVIDIGARIKPSPTKPATKPPILSTTFTPIPPDSALEFYDPVRLQCKFTSTYEIQAKGKYNFDWLYSAPITDGWEKAISSSCSVNYVPIPGVKMAYPTLFPLYYYGGKDITAKELNFIEECEVEVRNQRVNPTKLRNVTWSDVDALKGIDIFKYFEQPEAVIQSKDPVITQFVHDALGGANYRSKFKPYDACRKVFMAVLGHCRYTYPKAGEKDKRSQDAVQMAQTGLGDCGSYSMLLVACYRNMGIPARDACGGWVGKDAGHCWCEMWFPQAGWIVSDGSAGGGAATKGSEGKYAYMFGYIPNLNARMAIMRGNTFSYKNASTSWLQGPMWPPIYSNCTFTPKPGSGVITEVAGAKEGKKKRSMARNSVPAWNLSDLQPRLKVHIK